MQEAKIYSCLQLHADRMICSARIQVFSSDTGTSPHRIAELLGRQVPRLPTTLSCLLEGAFLPRTHSKLPAGVSDAFRIRTLSCFKGVCMANSFVGLQGLMVERLGQ